MKALLSFSDAKMLALSLLPLPAFRAPMTGTDDEEDPLLPLGGLWQ
ncbi:MAG TPA: hypothetical protein VEZ16_13395 [Microvirga sp.]|nr:hypothetical protein [Microvirga sp.]